MAKLPYMQFYPSDYQADVRRMSLAAQGAWMNIICTLWRSPKRGQLTMSLDGWANEIGRPSAEIKLLMIEMDNCGICDMNRENDDAITIKCRRMLRDERNRKSAAKRQRLHRHSQMSRDSHSDVTAKSQGYIRNQKSEAIYQKSESEEEKREERKIKSCDEVKPVASSKSGETWNAYARAYRNRYGVEPPRNKRTNALLCQLVDRVGVIEAPAVAEFYLSHNSPFYVRSRHPPNLLVNDAEGLRTQWLTGNKATSSEVKQAELQDDAREQVKRVEAMLARGL